MKRRFLIIGFEYDNLWKKAELFKGENEHGILLTADEFNEGARFGSIEDAEYKIQHLQANYSDYSWHTLVTPAE